MLLCVQGPPSLPAAPSVLCGVEQVPLAGSQTPATWHWSSALQTTGFAPVQVPAWQVSVWVQALPSLQAVPSTLVGVEQDRLCCVEGTGADLGGRGVL